MSNLSRTDDPTSHPGVEGEFPLTAAESQHQPPPVVDPALAAESPAAAAAKAERSGEWVDSEFLELQAFQPQPFLEEADALADAILDVLPTIRETVIERIPARYRPMAGFDTINDALVRYLRARRQR